MRVMIEPACRFTAATILPRWLAAGRCSPRVDAPAIVGRSPTAEVENFQAFPDGIMGLGPDDAMDNMRASAGKERFGAHIRLDMCCFGCLKMPIRSITNPPFDGGGDVRRTRRLISQQCSNHRVEKAEEMNTDGGKGVSATVTLRWFSFRNKLIVVSGVARDSACC